MKTLKEYDLKIGDVYVFTYPTGFQIIGKYHRRDNFYNGDWCDWVEVISVNKRYENDQWYFGAINSLGNKDHEIDIL